MMNHHIEPQMDNYYQFINQRFQEFMQHQLHEISNKFNLLSLSLEDLLDLLAEGEGASHWKEELSQVEKSKTKFLDTLSKTKAATKFKGGPRCSLEEAFAQINKIKVKELNKKSVSFKLGNVSLKGDNWELTPLLHLFWNYVSLRLIHSENSEFVFDFISREEFLESEKHFIDGNFSNEFGKMYLGEVEAFLEAIF